MARIDPNKLALEERVVQINRVAKVVKGGRRFSFSAIVVVGDGAGHVGAGLGKAGEVPEAIRKGVEDAKKNLIRIPMVGTTIPHEVNVQYSASKVMLKPASQGTGVIAGGSVRAVVEAAGIRDILAKIYGSTNPVNVTRATIEALRGLHSAEELGAPPRRQARQPDLRPAGRSAGRWPMPGKLRVTQVKSTISHIARNRATVRALGLKRIGHTVEVADNPATRGMVRQVRFLVTVEEVPGTAHSGATEASRRSNEVHDLQPGRPGRTPPGPGSGAASPRARARPPAAARRARRLAPAARSRPGSRAARRRSTCGSRSSAASRTGSRSEYEVVNVGAIARAGRARRLRGRRAGRPEAEVRQVRSADRQPGHPARRRARPDPQASR